MVELHTIHSLFFAFVVSLLGLFYLIPCFYSFQKWCTTGIPQWLRAVTVMKLEFRRCFPLHHLVDLRPKEVVARGG
jgi:hypothetical protein